MKGNRSDSAAGRRGAAIRHPSPHAAPFGAAAAQAITGGSAGPSDGAAASPRACARAAYVPPRLERLGAWNALTLQQSVPIFP
jgi:hypothetical protein